MAGLGGINPLAVLTERDPVKQLVLHAVAERMNEMEADRRRDLAIRLYNALNGKV